MQQDEAIRYLREMAGAASSCSNLPEIKVTIDVIEGIGRTALKAARVVHEYVKPSIVSKYVDFRSVCYRICSVCASIDFLYAGSNN